MKAKDPIEKLRDYAAECCPEYEQCDSHMIRLADEIEAAYMKWPVDADGVPIKPGDMLETSEYNYKRFRCLGFCYETTLTVPRWTVAMDYDGETGTTEYVSAHSCRHVKPDIIDEALKQLMEDLARERLIYVNSGEKGKEQKDKLVSSVNECAERIRKAMQDEY